MKTLEPTGKGQDPDWKAGIRHMSRQRPDILRQGDLSIPWCPWVRNEVESVVRSDGDGLVEQGNV